MALFIALYSPRLSGHWSLSRSSLWSPWPLVLGESSRAVVAHGEVVGPVHHVEASERQGEDHPEVVIFPVKLCTVIGAVQIHRNFCAH